MGISKRLQAVAGAVTPGSRIADIGTDHGYVPIYLVKNRLSPGAIAADINEGPLARAAENIRAENLSGKIAVRLGGGLKTLAPEETDTVVIAGMGGDLICRILRESPEFLRAGKELILQPQSEWFKVRRLLKKAGYRIVREWFLKEEGKYYLIIKAVSARVLSGDGTGSHHADEADSCACPTAYAGAHCEEPEKDFVKAGIVPDDEYGTYLIREKNPVFREYLEKEVLKKKKIAEKLCALPPGHETEEAEGTAKRRERLGALQKEIDAIEKILMAMR